MLAPLPLRPPPRPAFLRAWDQPLRHRAVSRPPGQLFFTQALQTLPPGAAMPASSCMRMPPYPMPSSTPWGHERGDQGIVECKLHTAIKAGNSTAPMGAWIS